MSESKKILIAEDELLIAKVLRMQFERRGFEVKNVVSGAEAVKTTVEWQPDFIILDIHLKSNSCGIAAAEKIRSAGNSAPIVFTTGNSYENTKDEVKNITRCGLISKPAEFEMILHKMEAL